MDIATEPAAGGSLCRLAGRLDTATSEAALTALRAAVSAAGGRVALDLAQVAYVSSAGLRVLLTAARQAKQEGGTAVLFGLQPAVLEVFEISGFGQIIPILADEAAARAALAG